MTAQFRKKREQESDLLSKMHSEGQKTEGNWADGEWAQTENHREQEIG